MWYDITHKLFLEIYYAVMILLFLEHDTKITGPFHFLKTTAKCWNNNGRRKHLKLSEKFINCTAE